MDDMADLHPALRPYSVGQLVRVHWIRTDGVRRDEHVKVVKVAVRDGQQFMFVQSTQRVDEHNQPTKFAIPADAIQRAVDADAANRTTASPGGERATDKQVAYAADLIGRLGEWGWHNSGPGQMLGKPAEADLKAMPRTYISALIDQLRDELGYND